MEDVKVVVKHRGVYCNTVGRFLSEAVVVEMMNKFKDAGFTDLCLIGNTDRIETLGLENHINLPEQKMFSVRTVRNLVGPLLAWTSRRVMTITGRCTHCFGGQALRGGCQGCLEIPWSDRPTSGAGLLRADSRECSSR